MGRASRKREERQQETEQYTSSRLFKKNKPNRRTQSSFPSLAAQSYTVLPFHQLSSSCAGLKCHKHADLDGDMSCRPHICDYSGASSTSGKSPTSAVSSRGAASGDKKSGKRCRGTEGCNRLNKGQMARWNTTIS